MRDTSPIAARRYYELLRARSPVERLATAMSLSRAVRQLAEASIRATEPAASDERVRFELAMRLYGKRVAERLFPERARG